MGLIDVVVLAVVQGAAEVLPVSATGHSVVARLWLDADLGADALQGPLYLATAAALLFALRHGVRDAIGEGVRAIARPTLFRTSPPARDAALVALGSGASLLVADALRPFVEVWSQAPLAVGAGLLATGAALASTALLRGARPGRPTPNDDAAPAGEAPGVGAMVAAGVAHGLATTPGASPVGAALVALLWLGVRPARAVELSLALSLPALLVAGISAVVGARAPSPEPGVVVAAMTIAFLSAQAAAGVLRRLSTERRTGALALWVIPLGLATLAYARALPGFT